MDRTSKARQDKVLNPNSYRPGKFPASGGNRSGRRLSTLGWARVCAVVIGWTQAIGVKFPACAGSLVSDLNYI
jgi:hypothetical protein